ncbi:hypothetical protein LTR37_005742 [Vermiconidia calcicola]|uniref:Uncharacterized protein n=1 Tax=Vermiconidia calcicola TaxID=1690605 RepID=A0ACC3NJY1_9PEZI|nr:hypothetical protein LTR37_005742 [Vermiconidia calcicola]
MIGNKLHLTSNPLLRDITPSSLILTTLAFALLIVLSYVVLTELYRSKLRIPNIPGPTGLPIVGNLYQLNPDPAETLHQWTKQYGGVYQILLGTMPVVVFGSMQAARDVFIGQGSSLLDKPKLYTFHSVLSSVASSIGTTSWSESTKRRRKTAASAMNRPAVASYLPFIHDLTRDLIKDLSQKGQGGAVAFDPRHSISRTITDLTLTVNYGARLPDDDALLEEIIDVEDGLSRIKTPLGSAQDFIPVLRLLPFNKKTQTAREINRRRLIFLNRFSDEMEARVKAGEDKACIQGNCLKDPDVKLDKIDLLGISMSMVSGGLDTMVNTLAWSIGTFALRPDIQDRAYQSICDVYGSKSWGPIEDENSVPYITALVKECLRTFCVLRLSLPRATWKDVQYGDIFIPKGTTVFLNAWGCNRDEDVFGPDAEVFRPERYLEDPELPHAAYGFGTRMCAGFQLANRQLHVLILRLLWSFKIEPSEDPGESDWQMRPLEDVTEPWHLAAIPPSFKVRFTPRDSDALEAMVAS